MSKEIIIRSQKEWDALPEKFDEFTIVKIVDSVKIINLKKIPGQSTVSASGQSTVYAYGQSTVYAYDQSTVSAYGQSTVSAYGQSTVYAYGFSVAHCNSDTCKITTGKYAVIQKLFKAKTLAQWIEIEGVKKEKGKLFLYKRVSKDFKTQEGNPHETDWAVDKKFKHLNWNPKENECGEGKFHACSHPVFCDEFRSTGGDKYVCISVAPKDCYLWPKASYPHKIAVRAGTVLYECDRFGEKVGSK
jgi:hypothetical protein